MNDNMVKALKCISSQNGCGECYKDEFNKNVLQTGKIMICRNVTTGNRVSCPFHQFEYSTDFDEGLDWLYNLAEKIEKDMK